MAVFAIGDIQGCDKAFARLREKIPFNKSEDELWLVGDLVNRGPGSLEVLRWLRDTDWPKKVVLGNHDVWALCRHYLNFEGKVGDTLDTLLNAPDAEELFEVLRAQPFVSESESHLMVHAGVHPSWTLSEAKGYADELRASLRGEGFREFLLGIASHKKVQWTPNLKSSQRLAALLGVFTRMRVCDHEGAIDFEFSGPEENIPIGSYAWFSHPDRKKLGKQVICGHWAALGLKHTEEVLALDTGCVWGRKLTAIRLSDGQKFEATCED